MREFQPIDQGSLKGMLEALLLVSTDAVPAQTLARALDADPAQVQDALRELAAEYADTNRGFQLREVAGGWRLFTHPAYHEQVERYVISWDTRRLSQAALETLAVIAYHQPVTREGVRGVRGVNSDGVISSLKAKGLVREVGRDARNAALLGTTAAFLEGFGLKSLDELPPLEDFAPDEESKRFIRERLSGAVAATQGASLEDAAEDLDADRELFSATGDEGDYQLGSGETPARSGNAAIDAFFDDLEGDDGGDADD